MIYLAKSKRLFKFALENKKKTIGVWCNGNTTDSGPVFPGSNPGIPTDKPLVKDKEVCRNARCTSFFVHHYTNLFTFFKLRSFEDFFDLCVPSI